ncbi:hypothetical protein [Sediminispirochaeta bajacaliforniensis]|uniref:hypothetical protein n=1 Tax=Sediminispirochaeta bajacaliforniensis TaxID=148 RepID=UPI000370C74C|nr:hypothetical protein [Sediminispirochaeta bajacaliforniensis]
MNSLIIWSKASRKRATALYGLFIALLTLLFTNCGIPTVVYLEAPDKIGSGTVGFYHADTNNPDIFQGYEIFYCFYDPSNPPVSSTSSSSAWESYAEKYLTNSVLINPDNKLMAYSYDSGLSHNIRRAYNKDFTDNDTTEGEYISVSIPVDPTTVSSSGGDTIRFILLDSGSTYSLYAYTGTTGESAANVIGVSSFISSLSLYRKVYTDSDKDTLEIKDFFTVSANDDDCPVSSGSVSVAFFAVATGFDSSSTSRIVSDITFIGTYSSISTSSS